MAHGRWSEVEARGVLEAWRRSGLKLSVFAKERGLIPQRLHWWHKKLNPEECPRVAKRLPAVLPVRVCAETPRRGEPVTVLLRTGHLLKVSHAFDEDAFARVVAILEGG